MAFWNRLIVRCEHIHPAAKWRLGDEEAAGTASKASGCHWLGAHQIVFVSWLSSTILFFFFLSHFIDWVIGLTLWVYFIYWEERLKFSKISPSLWKDVNPLPKSSTLKMVTYKGRVCGGAGCEGTGCVGGVPLRQFRWCILLPSRISIHIQQRAPFSAAGHDKEKGFRDGFLCVSVNSMLVKLG